MDNLQIDPPDVSEIPIPFVRYTSPDEEGYFERMNYYNFELFKLLYYLKYYNMIYRRYRNMPLLPPPNYSPNIEPR